MKVYGWRLPYLTNQYMRGLVTEKQTAMKGRERETNRDIKKTVKERKREMDRQTDHFRLLINGESLRWKLARFNLPIRVKGLEEDLKNSK